MINSFFVKCNMVRMSELEIIKFNIVIKLPFYLHIKDILNTFFDEETENIVEFYGAKINQQYDDTVLIDKYLQTLRYVDLKQFTIEVEDKDLLDDYKEYKDSMIKTQNGYVFKNHKSLYSFLVNELNFNEVDFTIMSKFVREEQLKLIINFSEMVEKEVGLGRGKDDISESFMLLRGAFELNHSSVIFPENKNLSFSEYSFREIKTQRIYLARKCEIEKMQYDEIMKDSKNKNNKLK